MKDKPTSTNEIQQPQKQTKKKVKFKIPKKVCNFCNGRKVIYHFNNAWALCHYC